MKRTFKTFTITAGGTPQPVVGTLLSAAVAPSVPPGVIPLTVADSSMFRLGDSFFIDVGTAAEKLLIVGIPDGTHITATILKPHADNTPIALSLPICGVYVEAILGNTGAIVPFYVDQQYGANQVAPNVTGLIKAISQGLQLTTAPNPPTYLSSSNIFGANPDDIGYYYVDGTTGDGYLPSVDTT